MMISTHSVSTGPIGGIQTLAFRDNDADAIHSRLGGLSVGTSIDVRPMTAVSGAGYQSQTFGRRFMERKKIAERKKTPKEITRQMEREIHSLIEESAQLVSVDSEGSSNSNSNRFLALEKAKEAAKKDKSLMKYRESNSLPLQQGYELTFATFFHLAVVYEKNAMFNEALETYNTLLRQKRYEAHTARIRINMGHIHHTRPQPQQNCPQAIKMYRMALDHTPRDEKVLRFRIHRTIGNVLVGIGKLNEAILDYEVVAMNVNNADMETCFNLLLCYVQTGDKVKAKQTFLKMVSVADKSLRNHNSHGGSGSSEDDNHDSDLDLSNVLDDHDGGDGKGESAAELALYQELGKPQKELYSLLLTAARLICTIQEHDNNWKDGYNWVQDQLNEKHPQISQQIEMELALQYLRKSEFESAIRILKSYETKDVDMKTMVAVNLSFVYFLEGQHSIADEYADVALSSNRFNPNALVNKGNSLFLVEEFAQAKDLYLEAIGVDSTNFEAIYNLGLANVRLGLISDAVQAFEKLHSVTSNNDPRVLYQVANLYDQTDDKASAMKWFNVLSACLPTDPNVLFRIGNLFDDEDDDTQSFHYHLESYRLYPSNLDVIGWLAVWFVKHEMYENSIRFFKCASQLQPSETKWCFMIASCYRKMGRNKAALATYESVRKKHPDDIECLRYLVSLCKELDKPWKMYEQEIDRIKKTDATK